MMTTTKLLDAAKAASGCTTDYQFAKKFGLLLATVSRWRTGKGTFDDDHAAMIAEILGREPGEVLALCQAQRAKTEAGRSMWLRPAKEKPGLVSRDYGGVISTTSGFGG